MAWFRIPRSFRTYLIVGLIITVAILTFSTSKMIRVDASDPKSTFPFLMISNNNNNKQQPSGATASAIDYPASLDSGKNLATLQDQIINNHHDSHKLDIHTTSVGGGLIEQQRNNLNGSFDDDKTRFNNKDETFSDTIVISPLPIKTTTTNNTKQQPTMDSIQQKAYNSTNNFNIYSNNTTKEPGLSLVYSNLPSARSLRQSNTQNIDYTDTYRKNYIRDMMKHAWSGYATYAWGFNEVRPVSKTPHTESIFGGEKMGASIVDGIDTLYIMGLKDEYMAARTWIENNLDFNKFEVDVSVFETNIRYVGGLLSIYALTKDQLYLNKAVQIADKLLPAFETPSNIPNSNVNLRTGYSHNHDWAYGAAILSEFGSIHLEFLYLSHATGDPKYREKALKIRDTIRKAVPRSDGLYNNYMSVDNGQWLTRPTHISMGGLGDSFYEYLIKAYVQSNGQDTEAYQMYIDAIKAFETKLIFTSNQSKLTYFAELKDTYINHRMDSLACFSGGMLALGATLSEEPTKSTHMTLASGIANTCHESCIRSKSHLGPETFVFSNRADATAYGPSEKYYLLRPEILETYFYMWRYTHDPKYRAWAWDFVEALERYCKAEGGYSGLRNVYQPVIKDDVQQSFFLAEVLKYLYLIFSNDDVVSLDKWVFNTEAHPLPIMGRN